MSTIKFLVIVVAIPITGCASISDIEYLQNQITTLKVEVVEISSKADSAKANAAQAAENAINAESVSSRAASHLQEVSLKLDVRVCRHYSTPKQVRKGRSR